jgi:hypothetical protein
MTEQSSSGEGVETIPVDFGCDVDLCEKQREREEKKTPIIY